jgi:multiple sugar transport system ATP-binding protein
VQTRTQIAALQRRLGTTTVYVTHDQVEAMTMGDRVAVLRFGKLQQFAAPNDLYDKPTNAFVAGFIGSPAMNLVTAPLTDGGVRIGDTTIALQRGQLTAAQGSGTDTVTIGIRPEHITIDGADAAMTGHIDLVEHLGNESYVHTHVGSGANTVTLAARAPGRFTGRLDDTVQLHLDTDQLHLFHPHTGASLSHS